MNIYELSLTLACLFLALLCVTTNPIELEDEMLDRELRADELFDENMDPDEMAVFRRDDEGFVRDAKAAQWSKNLMGISSLDNSVRGFASQHSRCRPSEPCKYAGKKMFNCKCNSLQYCVATTPTAKAYCKYSAVGFVFKQ